MAMYAGDTNVLFTADNRTHLLQYVNEYTPLLSDWLMNNKLQLSATKRTYIIFRALNKKIDGRMQVKFHVLITPRGSLMAMVYGLLSTRSRDGTLPRRPHFDEGKLQKTPVCLDLDAR